MRRVVAIAVIAEFCIVAILLYNDIKDFIWTHPWWHSFLVAIPGIAAPLLAYLELRHSREANSLREDANAQRERANTLQEEQNTSVEQIADLKKELDSERNRHLQQIAANTQRRLSEAEVNARILKNYLGQRAAVSEGDNNWGAMGAIIAEVNGNDVLTLFVPAGYNSSQAWGQAVRCDKLHIVEVPQGGCAVQIKIIERYGTHTPYGEARSWEERNLQSAHVGMQRGQNVFNAQYRKDGSPTLRHIYVYASTDGTPNYIMLTMEGPQETNSWCSSKLDIEKKFAVVQVEWADAGYRYDGGGGSGTLNLFTKK
jgi:hypothetical protein